MMAHQKRVLAGMAVTILALATVAPFAEAGTRRRTSNSDYYRGPVTIQRSYPYSGGTYYRRSNSSVGPALAGFFGGLLLGAVLTNHSNQAVYRDPYCDRDFGSRQAFIDHCNTYHRARQVRIVAYSNGNDYYSDCRDRGYYQGGSGYSGRTYDRDHGNYRGDGNWDNRDYRDGRDYRDSRDNRDCRDSRDSRDYRKDDGWQKDRNYRDRRDQGDDEDDDN